MPVSFQHTTRALESTRGRPWLFAYVSLVLLALWVAWLVLARIPVFESSVGGMIESEQQVREIKVRVAGVVTAHNFSLGKSVAAGDILLAEDAETQRRELEQRRERVETLHRSLDSLGNSKAAQEALISALEVEGQLRIAEVETAVGGRKSLAGLARSERQRSRQMNRFGVVSDSELQESRARATSASVDLKVSQLQVERERAAQRRQIEEQRVQLADIEDRTATTTNLLAAERLAISKLEHEIDQHTLEAPTAGRIGAMGTQQVGSFVNAGDIVASLVPDGEVRAVVYFAREASGRIHPGQEATLRFPAFPWTTFGTRKGRVEAVAMEATNNQLRVEIGIAADPHSKIPLEHGAIVQCDVTTEELSPVVLLLKSIGLLAT